MRWRAPDQEADQRGLGGQLCKNIVRYVKLNREDASLWIVVDGRS